MTIYEVKQMAIDALGEVDVSKLGVFDARNYCESLKFLSEVKDDAFFEKTMKSLTAQVQSGWNGPKVQTLNDLK